MFQMERGCMRHFSGGQQKQQYLQWEDKRSKMYQVSQAGVRTNCPIFWLRCEYSSFEPA